MTDPVSSNYTTGEVRTRIFIYVALAVFATLGANIMNLAAMSDQQLAAITTLRWTLTILLTLCAAIGSGLTAFRAAIDRSTAGGNGATPPADSANPQSPAPHIP